MFNGIERYLVDIPTFKLWMNVFERNALEVNITKY